MPNCLRFLLPARPRLERFFLLMSWLTAMSGLAAQAQAPVGRWQLHAANNSVRAIAEAGNTLYCVTAGGFFRYNRSDNQLQPLSSQEGFSDTKVAALAYDSVTAQVVLAYEDGTIDLLHTPDNRITALRDIQRKEIVGPKQLNHVSVAGRRAYVATSFGIVVLDLDRYEVRDTYANLGETGQVLTVYSTVAHNDSLYAATSAGVLAGALRDNLLDFARWKRYRGLDARALATLGGHVYAIQVNAGVVRLNAATGWVAVQNFGEEQGVYALTALPALNALGVARVGGYSLVKADGSVTDFRASTIGATAQVLRGSDGVFYVASPTLGLLAVTPGNPTPVTIAPNGPVGNVAWATTPVGAATYAVAGGYGGSTVGTGTQIGFSRLESGQWQNFSARALPTPGQYPTGQDTDLSAVAFNAVNGKLYLGSYGNGLLEWTGPGEFRQFDAANSPLVFSGPYTRVTGLATDAAGLVWVVNFNQSVGQPGLFSFNPATGEFRPHLAGNAAGVTRERVVLDDNGYKWLTPFPTKGAGLLVYNDATGRARLLDAGASNGGLLGTVSGVVKDRKGAMWVATSKGVQVFDTPALVLEGASGFAAVTARQPRNGPRFLFEDQLVTALAVDGSNRKWIGTQQGAWLFSEDGDQELAHFTTANSPLPSDKVVSLSVNGVTGEVFIGTERGLVAYRGAATEPVAGTPACAKVFPNPVPARFQGQIAFDELAPNAVVKITDVAGQLVYQTTANGSRAVWNGRDYQGRRVRTGIYLAYSADADGNNTCVSRVAVLGE